MTAGPPSARAVAWACQQRIDHHGAYANLVVPARLSGSGLDGRDRALVTDLVYGTTRLRRALDATIDRFVAAAPAPEIRSLLRLGAYQLLHARTPAHAAVSETVALAPKRARGFVNAVLRRVATEPMRWPSPAVELSYPDWIVEALTAELGGHRAVAALQAMNRAATVQVRGDGYVQDLGSQWVAGAVGATAGDRILDVCAAPGGKATAMAATGAFVVGADGRPHRAGLVVANARELGAAVAAVVADGRHPPFAPSSFDRVLLDAPCSGLGTLRRRPDARWRVTAADVGTLAPLQAELLGAVAPLVRPGGTLVYSVCTLLAAESTDHPSPAGFEVDPAPPSGSWEPYGHGWRVTPEMAETDGMIVIRWTRRD